VRFCCCCEGSACPCLLASVPVLRPPETTDQSSSIAKPFSSGAPFNDQLIGAALSCECQGTAVRSMPREDSESMSGRKAGRLLGGGWANRLRLDVRRRGGIQGDCTCLCLPFNISHVGMCSAIVTRPLAQPAVHCTGTHWRYPSVAVRLRLLLLR
jgi:hypothetical protein